MDESKEMLHELQDSNANPHTALLALLQATNCLDKLTALLDDNDVRALALCSFEHLQALQSYELFLPLKEAARLNEARAKPRPEHINQLELRSVLLALHWVLSHRSSVGQRVLLLLDSLVTHGALWKGRCASPSLFLILRKINSLLLASGTSLFPRWLPSALNPADAPSRMAPRGQTRHSDTA